MGTPHNPSFTETATISPTADQQTALARPPKRHASLLIYHREGVEVIPMTPGASVVVGREPPADIVLRDRSISRRHAQFTLVAADAVEVEDLGSRNGTSLAGARIERGTLRPGDEAQLGTVQVALHVLSGAEASPLGLEGHDAFSSAVEAEIARAKFFGRSVAVIIVRSAERMESSLPRWYPRVRALLRPVDRAGRYSPDAVEILLPEVDLEKALATGLSLMERKENEPSLVCGVSLFPGTASSAEEIIDAAWEAARRADADRPVQAASTESARTIAKAAGASDVSTDLVAESAAMRNVVETVTRLARAAIPVVFHGETGTGKEVLAHLLHEAGPRRDKPLVCVNCGAIPVALVESTLFGHERGAFSGAVQQQRGVFEAADGGTVFLDEIAELPAAAQVALLRVLEDKRVKRIGSTKEIAVDVRIVAASHRDLEAMSTTGAFRSDLYFRLSGIEVEVPPLRARRKDIPVLARRFLALASQANERPPLRIDAEAMALLERHAWPGNVRELRNAMERAVVIAEGDVVTARDLPARVCGPAAGAPAASNPGAPALSALSLKARLERVEKDGIIQALRETAGNQTEAARRLEMPLRTLQQKIKTYDLKKLYTPGT